MPTIELGSAMLPDAVLHDLLTGALHGLRHTGFLGINDQQFHAISPDLPFGDDEIRSAASFIRQHGTPARAVRFQCGTVINHVLLVAQTDDDLYDGQTMLREGVSQIPGATFTVLDSH